MAISLETITVGTENQATGSDSLFVAFNKTKNNFAKLANVASQYTNFVGLDGIDTSQNPTTGTVQIINTGVLGIVPGTGLSASTVNGVVTLSVSGYANGTIVAGVTNVNMSSNTLDVSGAPVVSTGTLNVELPELGSITPGEYVAPTLTVDAYGRINAIANGTSVGTVTSVSVVSGGNGINVDGSTITDNGTFTITNTGVTRLNAGPGIALSSHTGEITLSALQINTGTVTRVGMSSNNLSVSGSPITSDGDFTVDIPDDVELVDPTANTLTVTDTVTAAFFVGDGGLLSNIAPSRRAEYANTVTDNAQPNITSLGTLTDLDVSGNISADGILTITGNANVGNLGTAGLIVATGNITGGNLNSLGKIAITGNANVGNLGTSGLIVATGNITAGNLSTTGTITATGNANVGNIGATRAVLTGNATVGGNILVSANANVGNLNTVNIFATGNVAVSNNLTANGNITANANITGLNIEATANLSAANVDATNLTLTGNIVLANSKIYSSSGDNSLELYNDNSWVQMNYSGDQLIYADAYEVGIVTNNGAIAHNWQFDKTGNLTAPGSISASSASLSENLSVTGNAAITANVTVSGKANITGNVTGGNLVSNANVIASSGVIVLSSALPTTGITNGTIAIDAANSRIAVRIGGAWKYAALT